MEGQFVPKVTRPGRRGRLTVGVLVLIGVLAAPATASAQFWTRLGFGVDIGVTEPIDSEVEGAVVVGFTGGMLPDEGWGFAASLGWFEAELRDGRGGASRRIGDLTVRPLMGGLGYTWLRGRLATTASLTAGVSLNGGSLDNGFLPASADREAYALDVGNSFALRPSIESQYFLARKVALAGTASFLLTRPDIVLTTPEGRFSDRWNASSFTLLAGVVVYPFR